MVSLWSHYDNIYIGQYGSGNDLLIEGQAITWINVA